jgi:hypothetical protein
MATNRAALTEADFLEVVPASLRNLVVVQTTDVKRGDESGELVQAFGQALRLVDRSFDVRSRVVVTFSATPFEIDLSQGRLGFTTHGEAHSTRLEHLAFIHATRVAELPYPLKVTVILEEMLYCLTSIRDEHLISTMVDVMYEDITYHHGQYHLSQERDGSM